MNLKIYQYRKILNFLILLVLLAQGATVSAHKLLDFIPLVEENASAVVNISNVFKKDATEFKQQFPHDLPEDHPLYDFFNKRFFEAPPPDMDPIRQPVSLGSGFIISEDGYIITNSHVVKASAKVIVRLNDRREFMAEVVGSDKRSDIAVLKIEGSGLPTLKLGDSSILKVGEWVLAIGSPFGFDHSVTQGIISAIGRSLPNENYVPFIQTDVAINPGNSGGPLFNMKGEVIGVNSQIYSRTGGFMGMSFAIPIDVVSNVYQQLKENGYVSRGWLGVLIQDVTRELAESFSMEKPHGALVAKVLSGSPAQEAGLKVGDVIVNFNGNKIALSSDLPPMVGITEVGEKALLEVIRRGDIVKLEVKIAELPDTNAVVSKQGPKEEKQSHNSMAVLVIDIPKEQREQADIKNYGVLVSQIWSGPAYEAGIREGDLILLLNNIKINNADHFEELLDQLPEERAFPVLIQRRGSPIFLAMKLN